MKCASIEGDVECNREIIIFNQHTTIFFHDVSITMNQYQINNLSTINLSFSWKLKSIMTSQNEKFGGDLALSRIKEITTIQCGFNLIPLSVKLYWFCW